MVCCQERGWHNRRRPHLFDPFESSTLLIQLGGGGNPLVVEKWCLSFSNECSDICPVQNVPDSFAVALRVSLTASGCSYSRFVFNCSKQCSLSKNVTSCGVESLMEEIYPLQSSCEGSVEQNPQPESAFGCSLSSTPERRIVHHPFELSPEYAGKQVV